MNDVLTLRAFFRHYFLEFLGGVFAAYFSIAFAIALSFTTYFQNVPLADISLYILLTGAAAALLVVHSNFHDCAWQATMGMDGGWGFRGLPVVRIANDSVQPPWSYLWAGGVGPFAGAAFSQQQRATNNAQQTGRYPPPA